MENKNQPVSYSFGQSDCLNQCVFDNLECKPNGISFEMRNSAVKEDVRSISYQINCLLISNKMTIIPVIE